MIQLKRLIFLKTSHIFFEKVIFNEGSSTGTGFPGFSGPGPGNLGQEPGPGPRFVGRGIPGLSKYSILNTV